MRFFAVEVSDAYLRKRAPQPGYAMAVWRGRHVPDYVDLNPEKRSHYWEEVAIAGRALYEVYKPAQLNYLTYGNNVPHLHTYLVCRFVDDPSPGMPLSPFVELPVEEDDLRHRLVELQRVVAS